MRALISVSDKTGILELAKGLDKLGIEIISTGGTAAKIREAGIDALDVSDITGFPECLDGRVKTLHPKVHAGILAMRSSEDHMKQIKDLDVDTIDFVFINLYPFRQTISNPDVKLEDAIENIDIGGPTMLRSAAKNYQDVTVVVDPRDYDKVLTELKENGVVSKETKFNLCYKVFEHTASYDALIVGYLQKQQNIKFPEKLTVTYEKQQELRYGENPHQKACFYREMGNLDGSLAQATQLHGKELSYNNISDTNGALDILREFTDITVVGVKHANPCGVGSADTVAEAWQKAYEADSKSIFGGIVVTNAEVDAKMAEGINKIFIEIVVAPSYSEEALKILTKKKNIRLLELPTINCKLQEGTIDMKKVLGGMLVQDMDLKLLGDELTVVTKRKPTDKEMEDMMFAWKLVKHAKSNGIAIAKDKQSVGVGPGQVNRIWATEQAIDHGKGKTQGAALASDAFFPFDDCVKAAAAAGITTIIQPGGSKNDKDSIKAADDAGMAMVLTGMRHFKHS
ncbi:MAG: bifunctional phosphoribosylaminoimidazolecarboxamide formyltransferase/IMP cyclohydrolase [Clostridiales bacterium]|nr:bifunctional phosphoribosylaminoimidazolecarboxamide formyltransferase/IMP cyclohydrolase [Clostridiales bacterium]